MALTTEHRRDVALLIPSWSAVQDWKDPDAPLRAPATAGRRARVWLCRDGRFFSSSRILVAGRHNDLVADGVV
ncbi:MAG: hypothetical protein KY443_09090 [Actinobacteria bacterium]|nr:hypothetical protein [Actinomycetota bacterium]